MIAYYVLLATAVTLAGLSQVFSRGLRPAPVRETVPAGLGVARPIEEDRRVGMWTPFDVLLVALLVVFSGSRYFVGTDYAMYLRRYGLLGTNWAEQIAASPQEIGYTALALGLRTLTDDPYAIFWAAAVLTVVPAYIAIRRVSPALGLSVAFYICLGYYLAPFNIMRQGISLSFSMLAVTYLRQSVPRFAVLSVIAGLFHVSALIAAVVQFAVHRVKPSLRLLFAILGVTAVMGIAVRAGLVDLSWLLSVNERYDAYLADAEGSGLGTWILLAIRVAFLAVTLRAVARLDPQSQLYWTFLAVSLVFLGIGTSAVEAGRMELYFSVGIVFLGPALMARLSAAGKALVLVALVAYLTVFLLSFHGLVPYASTLT